MLLIVATFLAYGPALRGQFVWDDDSWTTGITGLLRDLSGLRLIWCRFTALQQYYPLTGTTFWLDYHLWGFRPLPYHVENVLLHALAALLFWQLLRRLQVPGAWLAAAVFALHPVMVESAGWITERKNVLSLVFYLGALLAYGRYNSFWQEDHDSAHAAGNSPPQRRGAFALACLLFLGALLAKTTTFSLPAAILLLCWWRQGHIRWRRDVLPTLPFFALALGLCLVTAWLEKNHVGAQGRDFTLTFSERCLAAGRAPWFYAGKLFWPANLCFIYPRWHPEAGLWWPWLYPAAAIVTLSGLWLARKRIGRGPATAVFFFTGTLFPVLGFMNAYGMRYSLVWDHWVYLSSLGLIALAAALVVQTAEWLRTPAVAYAFAAVILPVLAGLTWRQCGMYADMETLWQTTIAKNPGAFLAYNNLGYLYLQRGQVQAAIPYFYKTLQLNPEYIEARNNLGDALVRSGLLDEGMEEFKQAVEIEPNSAVSHYNFGNALMQSGRLDEAIRQFKKVLEIEPSHARACNNLGVALMRGGRLEEATAEYRQALELDPAYAEAHYNLGCIFDSQDKLDEAIAQYQLAVACNSNYAEAHYNLGRVLGLQGRLDDAIGHYRKAVEIKPDYADAEGNLANALAMQGKLDEAVQGYERTLALVPNSPQAHYRLGQALQAQKNFAAAMREYQTTLDLDSKHIPAHLSLAWMLATCPEASLRNGTRAAELARQAEQLAGSDSPQLLDTLAAAYAEAGQFGNAVETAKRALNLPATQNNQSLAETIQNQLRCYETNSPYHENP